MFGGFSLGEPIRLRNSEFITDYFGALSFSPRRGNEGAIFVMGAYLRGGSFAPTTTTWKESPPTMMGFPPRTMVPPSETNHPSEQCHAHHEGQLDQAQARRLPTELGPVPRRSSLTDRQMSYPVFMPKPSTHHMHDLGSNVPHIRPKVLTDNQMS
jgi:hypothetical protein